MQKNCFSYPVEIVEDVFGSSPVLADVLKKVTGSDKPKVLIVADYNFVQRVDGIGAKIGRYVQEHGIRIAGKPIVIAGGERIKSDSMRCALRVISEMLSAKLCAHDVVLVIGGGSLMDIAGYAASQVRGGVKLVRMPTSPAAMIDGAFAEYAAVDSATIKDALRVPAVPAAVVIDLAFAKTVLDGVWRGGLGEAVRLGVVSDAALIRKIEKLLPDYLARKQEAFEEIVKAAVAVRQKKGGTNFAQWLAMRLEAMSSFKLPHGYAIGISICVDLSYAAETKRMKPADRDRIINLLGEAGVLDGIRHSVQHLAQTDSLLQGLDEWALGFADDPIALPTAIGKCELEEDPDRAVFEKVLKNMITSATRT